MVSSSVLRNITHVAGRGVTLKNMRVITDLISISRNLKGRFDFIDNPDYEKIDILFINVDDEEAMSFYQNHGKDMSFVPIFLYDKPSGDESLPSFLSDYPNVKSLSRPIKLVDLNRVLLGIVSAKNASSKVRSAPQPRATPQAGSASKASLAMVRKRNVFRLLVVDDSFPVRKYLEEKLPKLIADIDQTIAFEIEFAASGREAVNKVKQARGAYDMVFLDIMMEDIDGYKICKWIKKVKRSINVVLLTSKSSTIDRMRGNLSGCDNYLAKPPKDVHLKKVIMAHEKLAKRALANLRLANSGK